MSERSKFIAKGLCDPGRCNTAKEFGCSTLKGCALRNTVLVTLVNENDSNEEPILLTVRLPKCIPLEGDKPVKFLAMAYKQVLGKNIGLTWHEALVTLNPDLLGEFSVEIAPVASDLNIQLAMDEEIRA